VESVIKGLKRVPAISENPWISWPCALSALGCLFGVPAVLLVFIVAFWTDIFGGGLAAVVIAELIVFGGVAGHFYVASKYDRW